MNKINDMEELQQYRAIGTVRQVQDFIEDWRKFRELGNLEELKALKEKNEAKKVFQPFGTHSYKCPSCWMFVAHEVDDNCDLETEMAGWCPYCGQKLDWQ